MKVVIVWEAKQQIVPSIVLEDSVTENIELGEFYAKILYIRVWRNLRGHWWLPNWVPPILAIASPMATVSKPAKMGRGMYFEKENGYIHNGAAHPIIKYRGVRAKSPSSFSSLNVSKQDCRIFEYTVTFSFLAVWNQNVYHRI